MRRLLYALAQCTLEDLHSESIVRRVLERHGIAVEMIPFYFFRVRANGDFSEIDVGADGGEHVHQCSHRQVLGHMAGVRAERSLNRGEGKAQRSAKGKGKGKPGARARPGSGS